MCEVLNEQDGSILPFALRYTPSRDRRSISVGMTDVMSFTSIESFSERKC